MGASGRSVTICLGMDGKREGDEEARKKTRFKGPIFDLTSPPPTTRRATLRVMVVGKGGGMFEAAATGGCWLSPSSSPPTARTAEMCRALYTLVTTEIYKICLKFTKGRHMF